MVYSEHISSGKMLLLLATGPTSDVQVCHQRLSGAFDLLLIFLCSLIQTLTLTPPPNNALLANMDMLGTHGRGAEASLVTDRQEISASCLKLICMLGIIFPCQQTGLEDCKNRVMAYQPASLANSYKHTRFTVRTIFYSLGNPEFKVFFKQQL